MHLCMATKTISVDLEAYERMSRARRHPRESFSQVIRRAEWPDLARTGRRLMSLLDASVPASEAEIRDMEEAQAGDQAPDDPWRES